MNEINRRIDLHMHSIESDGTDTVQTLLENIKNSGINIFSLTDHDTITGIAKIQELIPSDITFIKGIEFSCITPIGKCHILAYNYDETTFAFKNILEEGKRNRQRKLDLRIEFLKQNFGITFSNEELTQLHNMNSVGKPHLGNLLVKKGYANDKNTAIETYINPCKTKSNRLDGEKVIKAILEANGTPVWAHPLGGTNEKLLDETKFSEQLKCLKSAGIKGLECYYSRYSEDQVNFLIDIAEKNNLFITGGSDYHGHNKTVQLGELNAFGKTVTEKNITLPIT